MRVIGLKELKIAQLILPGNWPKVLDDPEVEKRATSIGRIGLIHEPVVREADYRLGPGRRRVAAHVRLGKETVLCKMVECSDDELELMVEAENAEREHNPAKQAAAINRLVDLLAKQKLEADPSLRPAGAGRKKSAKGIARDEVAAQLGVQPATIQQREQRERKRLANPPAKKEPYAEPESKPPPPAPEPTIASPWVDLEPAFIKDVAKVQVAIDEVDALLLQALSKLTRIKNSGLPCHADRIDRTHEDLAMLGAAVRGMRPTMVCPWCKGTVAQEKCTACRASGYITASQDKNVPEELLRVDNAVVVHLGEKKALTDYLAEAAVDDPFGLGE